MTVLEAVRGFFREQGFAEVETPDLQVSPGLEPHLRAFATELDEPFRDGPRARIYLDRFREKMRLVPLCALLSENKLL